tara:strand:+ start:227 stop:376 length:150 start_codon:yes stop_codon:yes gene_type:complete
MNKEQLEKEKEKLLNQQKQVEVDYHRISGAIAFVEQQLQELAQPKKDKK